MGFPDISITIGSGLGRRQPSEDNVSAMVMQGVAVSPVSLGVVYELNSVADAEALNLTAAYDTANKILVHHHISRFFKRCPNGKLFIMLVAQSVTLTQICDKTNNHLKGLLRNSSVAGRVVQAAVCMNPATGYTATLSGGLDGDVITALPKAQELAEEEFGLFRPVMILLEGRQFNSTVSAATNLRALDYENCAVVIAQDKTIADTVISSTTPYKYYAAIGDTLGAIAQSRVNESIGWVDKFPLTDTLDSTFILAGISSNVDVATMEADYTALHDKGYIFAAPRIGKPGYFFNAAPTCALATNDRAYIENTRTLNKAARLIRSALLGDINSPVPLNPDGTMAYSKLSSLEAKAKSLLVSEMQTNGEISACSVFIDPTYNFIQNGEKFEVEFNIVPVGVARSITAKIQLTASI